MRRRLWLLSAAPAVVATMLVPTGSARAASSNGIEGETLRRRAGDVQVVRDQIASRRRALRLAPGAAAARRVRTVAFTRILIRARPEGCAPRLRVTIDGTPVPTVRVRRTRNFRYTAVNARAKAGRHSLRLSVARRARCRLRVDRLLLMPPPRLPPPPTPPPPAPAPAPSTPTDSPPALGQTVEGVRRTQAVALGAAVTWAYVVQDAGYREAFLREFKSLTPENEMKMMYLQPRRGEFDFAQADQLVAFAQANGKEVHGHTLVWHSQNPAWLTAVPQTAPELSDIMRRHIQTVMGHYRGRVREWDVINEPLETDGSLRRNTWLSAIGEDYVAQALRFAREADPNAHLFINEIDADVPNPKSDALYALARRLRLADVPLDGVGLQLHTGLGRAPSREALEANIRRFAELGLRVQITEMDVAAEGPPEGRAERLATQAQIYGDAAAACQAVPACERLTVWGVSDRYSWLGASQEPLLLDANYVAKPALHAVRGALAAT